MKKKGLISIVSIVLAVGFILSACSSAPSLTKTTWLYNGREDVEIMFNKDNTGVYNGEDIKWNESESGILTLNFDMGSKQQYNAVEIDKDAVVYLGVPDASYDNQGFLVSKETAKYDIAKLQNYMVANATDFDGAKIEKDYNNNSVSAVKEYCGKFVIAEGEIKSMDDSGDPAVFIRAQDMYNTKVYLSDDDFAKVSVGQTIKVVGMISMLESFIDSLGYVAVSPAFIIE
ncbi:MAG: hypothetical protein IJS03_00970 [Eubacterium sp.]|nr:hypothetical protein [Eubacterium sp.]